MVGVLQTRVCLDRESKVLTDWSDCVSKCISLHGFLLAVDVAYYNSARFLLNQTLCCKACEYCDSYSRLIESIKKDGIDGDGDGVQSNNITDHCMLQVFAL
jgi:hypothetical protein